MVRLNRLIAIVLAVAGARTMPCRAEAGGGSPSAPTTRPAGAEANAARGSIVGKVTSDGEVPLSEMVVYLESPDGSQKLPVPTAHAKVSQKGAKFSPPLVIVSVGQTVDFLNDEDRLIEHNVFSNSPARRFDLGMYPPGQSRSVTFDKPGPVFLYCSIHRYMDGVVFVSPTPLWSRVNSDGTYRIDDVPPGVWLVKTWQRRRRFKEASVPVLVQAGKSITTDLELRRR